MCGLMGSKTEPKQALQRNGLAVYGCSATRSHSFWICTPFQNATKPAMFLAAGGSG
jgi:hypothetical protein